LVIAVPVALIALIGLYLLLQKQFNAAYAAVAAFVGATGLSGATITAAVRNALQKTEDDLWAAELGAAVAVAIDHVPTEVPNSHVQSLLTTSTTQTRGGRVRH
jgi:ABC-type siderophore export system fused ATPase/permease subunit